MDEKSKKVDALDNTIETVFQNLLDDFLDKKNLVDDLEDEVKTLSRIEHASLIEKISWLEAKNTQLTTKVSHLQASVDELHEEVGPL